MRILVADDDYNYGYVLKRELEDHSFTVDVVNNGVEVILNLIAKSYDFVLLDIIMPRLNGLDTLKIINSLKTSGVFNPHMQVITFSGENHRNQKESMQWGALKFIKKPFSVEALTHLMLSLSELSV